MFEKEAEEYSVGKAHEHYNYLFEEHSGNPVDFARWCFQDGANFGYNKANEWHDLRKNPNDLPKEEAEYLVIFESDGTRYKGIESYYPDTKEWSTICNILIWKEIIPPKEVK